MKVNGIKTLAHNFVMYLKILETSWFKVNVCHYLEGLLLTSSMAVD